MRNKKRNSTSEGSEGQNQENMKCIMRFCDHIGVLLSWVNSLKPMKMLIRCIRNIDILGFLMSGVSERRVHLQVAGL